MIAVKNLQNPHSNKKESSVYSIYALGWPLEHGAWCAVHVGGQQTITYNFRAFYNGARRHALNWLGRRPLWSALFFCPSLPAARRA